MSELRLSPESSATADPASAFGQGARDYALSDDLAKLCLPTAFKDEYRTLAWVNSICFLFLLIGIIGLKPPMIVEKPLSTPQDIVPVVFTPPEEQSKPDPEKPEEEPPPTEEVMETPQVVTAVAPSTADVAFAVPVKGPVVIAPSARLATPPPVRPNAPRAMKFDPNAEPGGTFPIPSYPREELMARHTGDLMLDVVVDPSGVPASVTVKDGSGYPGLDRHAVQWVKTKWHFLPGAARHYLVPVQFQLK